MLSDASCPVSTRQVNAMLYLLHGSSALLTYMLQATFGPVAC